MASSTSDALGLKPYTMSLLLHLVTALRLPSKLFQTE